MKTHIHETVTTASTRKIMASDICVINRTKGRTIKFV